MIRHAIRTALVASLVVVASCGPAPRESAPSSSAGASSTTPSTTQSPTSTSTAPATTSTTTPNTTNLPTTTIKNQSASNSPRTTTTTVAELPGGIQVSASSESVIILSDGLGPLQLRSITETTGSGITLDTSLCGSSLPAGNVCFVYLRTTGLTSGTTINGRVRIESNAPTSPDIVNVTITVP